LGRTGGAKKTTIGGGHVTSTVDDKTTTTMDGRMMATVGAKMAAIVGANETDGWLTCPLSSVIPLETVARILG
jgi:hypothetical protein